MQWVKLGGNELHYVWALNQKTSPNLPWTTTSVIWNHSQRKSGLSFIFLTPDLKDVTFGSSEKVLVTSKRWVAIWRKTPGKISLNYDAGELSKVTASHAVTRRHRVLLGADIWYEETPGRPVWKQKGLNGVQDWLESLSLPVCSCQGTDISKGAFGKLKKLKRRI